MSFFNQIYTTFIQANSLNRSFWGSNINFSSVENSVQNVQRNILPKKKISSLPLSSTDSTISLRFIFLASLLISSRAQVNDSFPASFGLSSLNASGGLILNGETDDSGFGLSVSRIGDFNGDSFDDVILGAPSESLYGRCYVLLGSKTIPNGGAFDLTSFFKIHGFILEGDQVSGRVGYSVSGVGDVNGDGFDDFILGADGAGKNYKGRTYVVFGQKLDLQEGKISVFSLDKLNGYFLEGENDNDYSGLSVSGVGDVNGDGLTDFIIGAPFFGADKGRSYVVFGQKEEVPNRKLPLSILNGINGYILEGEAESDRSGWSVSGIEDVNGDGFDDIIIGAWGAINRKGRSYVVFGQNAVVPDGLLHLSRLNGTNGYILEGESENDESGTSVSGLGDVNGDGLADFIIGAPKAGNSKGRSYLVFGHKERVFVGKFKLSGINGDNGYVLQGDKGESGWSVSGLGDVNGDGLDDIGIGAPDYYEKKLDIQSFAIYGRSYVIFGSRVIRKNSTLQLESLNGLEGFIITSQDEYYRNGWIHSSAGDINGDGVSDFIIGSPKLNLTRSILAGRSYLVFGRSDKTSTITPKHSTPTSSVESNTDIKQITSSVTEDTGETQVNCVSSSWFLPVLLTQLM